MFNIDFAWKAFRIHTGSFHKSVQTIAGPGYVGASADADLTLWFTEQPADSVSQQIQDLWGALSETQEAIKFAQDAALASSEAQARAALPTSDMLSWSAAERKIFMNMPLTDDDRAALLAKYPQP